MIMPKSLSEFHEVSGTSLMMWEKCTVDETNYIERALDSSKASFCFVHQMEKHQVEMESNSF